MSWFAIALAVTAVIAVIAFFLVKDFRDRFKTATPPGSPQRFGRLAMRLGFNRGLIEFLAYKNGIQLRDFANAVEMMARMLERTGVDARPQLIETVLEQGFQISDEAQAELMALNIGEMYGLARLAREL